MGVRVHVVCRDAGHVPTRDQRAGRRDCVGRVVERARGAKRTVHARHPLTRQTSQQASALPTALMTRVGVPTYSTPGDAAMHVTAVTGAAVTGAEVTGAEVVAEATTTIAAAMTNFILIV